MPTPAVTTEAPAVSESNSTFLPTDEHYRLTGEKSAEPVHDPRAQREERKAREAAEEREKKAAVTQEASAASGSTEHETPSSTAAASEAAPKTEDKGPAATKTPQTSESRWAKMSRENRELREQLAKATVAPPKEAQRETQQPSQAATEDKTKANVEPQIDDKDPNGKPKYATLNDYIRDLNKWNREEAKREFQEMSAKTQREQQQASNEQIIETEVSRRAAQARKDHPDYDELFAAAVEAKDDLGRPVLYYTKGSHLDGFFLDSERSHDVFHEIFKDFDKHGAIFARDAQGKYVMNPVRQLRELAKIENSLPEAGKASTSSTSVRQVTQAPRPPHQVSGKGNVTKDAVERAVEEGDTETYMREQNARALARLAKKG